jgi:hypothetical protein
LISADVWGTWPLSPTTSFDGPFSPSSILVPALRVLSERLRADGACDEENGTGSCPGSCFVDKFSADQVTDAGLARSLLSLAAVLHSVDEHDYELRREFFLHHSFVYNFVGPYFSQLHSGRFLCEKKNADMHDSNLITLRIYIKSKAILILTYTDDMLAYFVHANAVFLAYTVLT